MIKLSEQARRLTSTFFTYRNNIDIYTEDDANDKEFYKLLFKRLLEGKVVINDVTPLGCRKAVINRCKNEPNNGRKKIFIIDGDLSLLNGKREVLDNLYVLDAYCIENMILDEISILKYIYIKCASHSYEDIENMISFEDWLKTYKSSFLELFIHLSIMDLLELPFKLHNAQRYHVKVKGKLIFDDSLVNQAIQEAVVDIEGKIGKEGYNEIYLRIKKTIDYSVESFLKFVSGKDYLIPLILMKTNEYRKSNSMPSSEEFKFELIQYCGLSKFENLKKAILSLK